jgi:hypothetical protein
MIVQRRELAAEVVAGEPVGYGRLMLIPLWLGRESDPEYFAVHRPVTR